MAKTTAQLYAMYGDPRNEANLAVYYPDAAIRKINPAIPAKIYCNRDIMPGLTKVFALLAKRGLLGEIRKFDGCFNIRNIRGGGSTSKHSYGYAVDFNAADNILGYTYAQLVQRGLRPFSEAFLQCWRECGFTCGGDWASRPDRMHFEM